MEEEGSSSSAGRFTSPTLISNSRCKHMYMNTHDLKNRLKFKDDVRRSEAVGGGIGDNREMTHLQDCWPGTGLVKEPLKRRE